MNIVLNESRYLLLFNALICQVGFHTYRVIALLFCLKVIGNEGQ